jgi:hypothetical protein
MVPGAGLASFPGEAASKASNEEGDVKSSAGQGPGREKRQSNEK